MTQDYRIKNYTPKNNKNSLSVNSAYNALMLLVGRQEGHPACKKTERWGADVVICLERGAGLHTAQLMPPTLAVSCFSKIQIGFTFLVLAHLGSPGQRAVKRMCSVCRFPCKQFPFHQNRHFNGNPTGPWNLWNSHLCEAVVCRQPDLHGTE